MIDVSHDNSGKDPERQPAVAAEVAAQIAGGADAIVGVMLESFLVAGRQDLDSPQTLTYGQSITDACIDWETTVEVLDGLAAAVRTRRGARRSQRVRIAIVGVGLIGGSIALAARERLGASVAGFDRLRASALEAAIARGALDARPPRVDEAVADAEAVFVAVPVGALEPVVGAVLAAAAGGLRRHRRRLDQARRRRRSRRSAVRRRPPARGRRDRRACEHARADLFEGATWYLTPTSGTSGLLYERLYRLLREPRRAAGRRSIPHTHDTILGDRLAPAARARQRARLAGRPDARRGRRAAAGDRPELSRRDPRGRRAERDLDRHLPLEPRRAERPRSTTRSRA